MLSLPSLRGLVAPFGTLVMSAMRAIDDPNKGDMVAAVGELTACPVLPGMVRNMMSTKDGRALLMHRPRVTDATLEYARTLPAGTFGHSYAQFMDANGFLPSGRPDVRYVGAGGQGAEAEMKQMHYRYAMTRYREVHDFVHALVKAGRTTEEEVAVKLLEYYHTGLPLGLLAVAGGGVHLHRGGLRRVLELYQPWAAGTTPSLQNPYYATAADARSHDSLRPSPYIQNLLCVHWEKLLPRPHDEVLQYVGWSYYPGPSSFPTSKKGQ